MKATIESLALQIALAGVFAIVVTAGTGCSLMATGMWIVNPNDAAAEYDGLEDRRVAVVCQPNTALALRNYGVGQELAERVSAKLGKNIDGVEMVPQSEINDWTDQHQLKSISEFGKAMNADVVVAINLPEFRLYSGKSMMRGEATAEVEVHDIATGELLHELEAIDSLYPPENGIPIELSNQRSSETRFRRKYLGVLADQISRRFYAHDSRQAVKMDRFYKE